MNGTRVEPPEWLYLDAGVLLVDNSRTGPRAIRNAVVVSIAPKTCLVQFKIQGVLREERIPLGTLRTAERGDIGRYWYELVEVRSERGEQLLRLRSWWALRNEARRAAAAVSAAVDDPEVLEPLLVTLTRWSEALTLQGAEMSALQEKLAHDGGGRHVAAGG
jgi:hypothetical protein